MYRWSRTAKRLLLAATLLPGVFAMVAIAGVGAVLGATEDPVDSGLLVLVALLYIAAVALIIVCGIASVIDVFRGDRVVSTGSRALWTTALLLAGSVAAPAYWWLYVRPDGGQPYGPQTLTPGRSWPVGRKTLSGIAAHFAPLFMAVWFAFVIAIESDHAVADSLIVAIFLTFALWTVATAVTITLFVLDAVRSGGDHAIVWGLLLALVGIVSAPVYWWMHVRPSAGSSAP